MKRRTGFLAAGLTVALVAAGGTAFAAVSSSPGSSGMIHGCYDSGGNVKVINTSPTSACPRGYAPLNWSQTGPLGPAGPQGPAGPVHEVTGAVNPNCTLQGNPSVSIVTSKLVSLGVCHLTFGASDFSNVPILLVTPINASGGNPTGIFEGRNGDGTWYAQYSFAGPTLLNFIASQLTS
jgi:hypothetical protein